MPAGILAGRQPTALPSPTAPAPPPPILGMAPPASGLARALGAPVTGEHADRPVDARGAVAQLFEEASDLVHRTAWRITRNAADADDVLQGVFTHVLRHPPSPWPENPVAYVHRAAVNAALDVLRQRRRRPEAPAEAAAGIPVRSHEERDAISRIESERLAARLADALLVLSPLEAEVFSLRCFEEMSNQDIARLLARTPNHVGVTLHAARTKLKAALLDPARAPLPVAEGDAP